MRSTVLSWCNGASPMRAVGQSRIAVEVFSFVVVHGCWFLISFGFVGCVKQNIFPVLIRIYRFFGVFGIEFSVSVVM